MNSSPVRRSQEEIDELLRELEGSGETAAAFANRRGVPVQTVYGWTKRRREKSGKRPANRKSRKELVRVSVGRSEPSTAITYELVLDGFGTVRIPSGFDEVDLVRLLRALREPC